jgi:WD40 repeat protein
VPRGERPLDDSDDVLVRFAAELRLLRQKAGSPTYRELAQRAHFSSSTLAEAAAGRKLPSLPVTLAYVRACDADDDEWAARWHETAAELATAREPVPDSDDGTCPYVGLAAFQPEDAARFHGRERLTDELVARVRAHRFVGVFGASGSGKSSLLRAGVVPAMADPVLLLTPGPRPLEECAVRLASCTGRSAVDLRAELAADPRALHLAVLQALAGRPPEDDLVLVVDQFEEIFTLCEDERERARFVELVVTAAQAANSRTRVVLGVRADFYARCSEDPRLVAALRDAQFLVGPMATDELRRAISQPAVDAGRTVDGALLARVIADAAGQDNVLPLVSHAMRETWQRRRGNALSLAGYESSGGIRHALARTAEQTYAAFGADRGRIARSVFLRLVAIGDGTVDTKRRVTRDELGTGPDVDAVVETLARARLLTLATGTVEITHEALLSAWPRLRGWLDEDRAGLFVQQQLLESATVWDREHRDPSLLFRGGRLLAAAEWAGRDEHDTLLGERARDFLAASVRFEQRGVRLRRAVLAVLAVLVLLAGGGAVVAYQQRAAAQQERDRAVAGRLLAEAGQLAATDSSLAAQLDLVAYRRLPSRDAATSLLATGDIPLSTPLTRHTGPVYAVAYRPDGRLLATGGGDDTIQLWRTANPARPTPAGPPLKAHRDWVYWLAFSPDGHTLASASRDGTARLWDVRDPGHPRALGRPLTGHHGYVFSVSFSGDGRTLATASYDHTVRLWNVADPAHATPIGGPLTGHTDSVASAAVSPDGRTVASAGHDHVVRLWNVARHAMWGPDAVLPHDDTVYAVAFSPDSRTAATVGNDRAVHLWDVHDPAHPVPIGTPLPGHTDTLLAVAFSPDGHRLATAGADHTVRLWDVTDPAHAAPAGPPLVGHTGIVNWVAFGPGNTLASASDDHTVRIWSLPTTAVTGHTDAVDAVAFAPDGHTLATAGADRTVRLWNVRDPGHPVPWGAPLTLTDAVTRLAYRGHLLVTANSTVRLWDVRDPAHPAALATVPGAGQNLGLTLSPQGTVMVTDAPGFGLRLWDVRDPARPAVLGRPLTGHISAVQWAGFSPDGHTLASVSSDDKVRLWDVREPAHPRALPPVVTGDTVGLLWGAFSPSGAVLAIAGGGQAIRLWDVRDPAHPRALARPLTGHTGPVQWVGFSPDGNTLASAGADNTMRLWDVVDPSHPGPAGAPFSAGHTSPVNAAAFNPSGTLLASGGGDHVVELSPTDVTRAAHRICTATHGVLTPDLWTQYVPDIPYSPPCR